MGLIIEGYNKTICSDDADHIRELIRKSDKYYYLSDDSRAYAKGEDEFKSIVNTIQSLLNSNKIEAELIYMALAFPKK